MKRSILVLFLIALILVLSAVETRAVLVTVRSDAGVVSGLVRLGDVAAITGADSHEQLEELRSIAICSAPPPAEVQILGLGTIASALKASDLDLSRLRLTGFNQVLVRREYALVSVQELTRVFSRHVFERTGWALDSFLVEAPKNLRPAPVPIGERTIAVETFPDEDFCGSVLAHFQVSVDGKPYRKFTHRFRVERYVEALVTVRKIPRGHPVSDSDVEVTKVEQSLLDGDSLTRVEQAIGLLATRTILSGRVLSAGLLTGPPIVHKGDLASLIWDGDGFSIMTKARLLEDGCADQVVRVRLPTRKILKAKVLDSKTLRILREGERDETS